MKLKIVPSKILLLMLGSLGCATTAPQSSTQTWLAARIARAGTHNPCMPNTTTTENCFDDQGLVWSTCAWNTCGLSRPCREVQQRNVAAGSCGEPEWPACRMDDRSSRK